MSDVPTDAIRIARRRCSFDERGRWIHAGAGVRTALSTAPATDDSQASAGPPPTPSSLLHPRGSGTLSGLLSRVNPSVPAECRLRNELARASVRLARSVLVLSARELSPSQDAAIARTTRDWVGGLPAALGSATPPTLALAA
jgi:hypothetical protein